MADVIEQLSTILADAMHKGVPQLDAAIQTHARNIDPVDPPVGQLTTFATELWGLFCDQVASELPSDPSRVFGLDTEVDSELKCPNCDGTAVFKLLGHNSSHFQCHGCGYAETRGG